MKNLKKTLKFTPVDIEKVNFIISQFIERLEKSKSL